MVEVWADGVKVLFGGDMGPDTAPILCRPAQHYEADAVLVESTYGPTPREEVSYEDFGRRVMKVIARGGSVLIPSFAVHKTQLLIHLFHRLARDKVVDPKVPVFSDSSTAQRVTALYDQYKEYYDAEARAAGGLFYRNGYRDAKPAETLACREPAVYLSTSGMLQHAVSPKHLHRLAGDPKNAVFLVGYQAPNSLGRKLLEGARKVDVPWEELGPGGLTGELRPTEVKLQVEAVGGFSGHARGQQILEWLHNFRGVGAVFVVHGGAGRAAGLAEAAKQMGLNARAPQRGESFEVGSRRVKAGPVPKLAGPGPAGPDSVDR
jgi:metallo-beta-lactamase family protein